MTRNAADTPQDSRAELEKAIRGFRKLCFEYRDDLYRTQRVQDTGRIIDAQNKLNSAIQAYVAEQVAAKTKQAEATGAYMAAGSLLQNVGYLLAHRADGDLPSMSAEVVGNLYDDIKKILADNKEAMLTTSPNVNKSQGNANT